MRRRITPLNFLLFSSSFLLVFVLAVFINVRINAFLLKVGDGVVSSLEKNFNVRISYGPVQVSGIDSLIIRDVVIRRSAFHDPAEILTVRELRVKFNFLQFIFTSKMEEYCLRGLEASGVVYNHYPERKTADRRPLTPVLIRKPSSGPPLDPARLSFHIRVLDGWARLYGSPYRVGGSQAPLAQAQIQDGLFNIRKGRIKVNFRSRTGLVDEGFFSTRLDVSGDLDILRKNGDLLFSFHDSMLAGAGMPDIKFFASMRGDELSVDSAPFKQPIRLQGLYRGDGTGKISLGFSEESKFFVAFLKRYFPGEMDLMFIRPGEKYSPEGQVVLNFSTNSLRLQGDLAIRTVSGEKVFEFQCRGDEKRLFINRIRLARLSRLIEFRGVWRYTDELPQVYGVLRQVAIGGQLVSGTVRVDRPGAGRYFLRLGGVSLNGAPLGSFGTYLTIGKNGVSVDTAGMSQGLQVNGRIRDDRNLDLRLGLGGYSVAVLARALGIDPFWEGRTASGNARLVIEDGFMKSSGVLSATDRTDPKKQVSLSYSYEKGRFLLHNASFPEYGLRFSGVVDESRTGIKTSFVIDHKGKRFNGYGSIQDTGGEKRVYLAVPGKLTVGGVLGAKGVFTQYRVVDLPLDSLGVKASVSGKGSLSVQNGAIFSDGSITASGSEFEKWQVKGLDVDYRLAGNELKLKRIAVDGLRKKMEGSGALSFTRFGVRGNLSFGDSLNAYFNIDSGWVDGRVVFKGYRLLGLIAGDLTGTLDGDVLLSGKPSLPALSCNLTLKDGSLGGTPVSGFLRSAQVPQGIRISSGRFRYGKLTLDLGGGGIIQSVPEIFTISLAARMKMASEYAAVSSGLQIDGSFDGSQFDVRVLLGDVAINSRSFGSMRSRLQFSKGRVNILRKSATGISGFYDLSQGAFSFKLYTENRLVLDSAGETKPDRVDYFLKSENLPLGTLNLFPKVFSSASGNGTFQLNIVGHPDDVRITGHLKVTNGSLAVAMLQSPIEQMGMDIKFAGNRILLAGISGKSGGESVLLDGSCFFRKNRVEDLNFRFRTGRKSGIPVRLDLSGLKVQGRVFADLFLRGDPGGPDLQGRVAIKDADINYLGSSSSSGSGKGVPREGVADRINWHVDFTALERVNYLNPLVTVVIKPQSRIGLRNRMADSNFTIKGTLQAAQGTLDYLGHQFKVESPTYLEFKQLSSGYDAWLVFKGSTIMRDDDQEKVTVYIAYNGSLSADFKPYFYSEPVKTEDEILVLLGVQPSSAASDKLKTQQRVLYKSTDVLASIGLQPFSRMVRKSIGLDLFTIRTSVVRYFLERESLDSMDPKRQLNILRDTQFTFGKYLTSFLFIEYTLTLKEDPDMPGDLVPAHQFGLELSFSPFNLGYSLKQTDKSGYTDFEQSFEIRFRKRF